MSTPLVRNNSNRFIKKKTSNKSIGELKEHNKCTFFFSNKQNLQVDVCT